MKIIEAVRKCAAEQGMAEEEALAKGMAERSKEFVEKGVELTRRRELPAPKTHLGLLT